jgi:proteic killer suppression protein
VITSFKSEEAALISEGRRSRKLPADIQATAFRKLGYLSRATPLTDLMVPPGNRLEVLHGNRTGQHSIRINDQWRICFVWDNGNVREVEIVEYH